MAESKFNRRPGTPELFLRGLSGPQLPVGWRPCPPVSGKGWVLGSPLESGLQAREAPRQPPLTKVRKRAALGGAL